MLRRFMMILSVSLSLSFMLGGQTKDKPAAAGETFNTFTGDGSWCWFSDPRAVYYENTYKRTYAGWIDSKGNVTVGYYDHDTKGQRTAIIHENLESDDHNGPSLLFDEQGKLTVFYSRHSFKTPIYMMQSRKSEHISDWQPRRVLALNDTVLYSNMSNTYTYTNICRLSEAHDKWFLFWRGSDYKPNVSTSPDGGQSWTCGRIMILPPRIYRNRRPYLKVTSNGRDKIHFAFTDGHPRDEPNNSIYYACYFEDAIYRADGKKILDWSALPLNPDKADKVYDASVTGERAWIWDVAQDTSGNPVIVFATFPDDSNHHYHYARWDGDTWAMHKLVNSGAWFPQTPIGEREPEPHYSGGVVLDHENPSIVYLSRQKKGIFEIEKWSTLDGGINWSVDEITRNSRYNNIRPFAVSNAGGDNPLQLLWMQFTRYLHYTDYRSAIKMDVRD